MDEIEIDSFIAEIQEEMDILRAMEHQRVFLTESQKDAINKLPKSKREEMKKKFLKEAREIKRERMSLLLCALENKIKNSNLPPEAKKALARVMQQAKDNGWKLSPQNIEKVEEIKKKEMAEGKEKAHKEKQKENVQIAEAVLTSAVVGAVVAGTTKRKPKPAPVFTPQTKTIQNVAGTFMLPDNKGNMNPEYVEKAMNVGQKALEEIKMPKDEISILAIKNDTSLLPIQKRYAEAVAMELRPDIKQDKLTEDRMIKTIAIKKSIERHARKQAKREGKTVQGTNKRPNWSKQEALVMKRVNRIKQSAGTSLSMDEIKERLGHPALIRIYEARMRKDHPEYFAEQNKYMEKQEQIAKLRSIRRSYRKEHNSRLAKTLERAQERETRTKGHLGNKLKNAQKSHQEKTLQTAIKMRSIQNARKKIA